MNDGAQAKGVDDNGVNFFTLPQTQPFLLNLAQAVLAGHLPHADGAPPAPIELARYEILLPSRRACRALSECFFQLSPSTAVLLPRIRPLGDVDEIAALVLSGSPLAQDDSSLRPAVPELERRLLLTELVHAWAQNVRAAGAPNSAGEGGGPFPVASLAQATALAGELMDLMDEVELEGADLDKVHELGGDFPEHWKLTVRFLEIITETWPEIMRERQQMTAVARRDLLIRAEAARYAAAPPEHPVILAGEIGGVAATGQLMKAIARAPQGAVVLPGLDKLLDPESWDAIIPDHPEHPQYGLKQLLDRCNITPSDVAYLRGCEPVETETTRLRIISETMRPARTTHRWQDLFGRNPTPAAAPNPVLREALAHFNLIEAACVIHRRRWR